MKVYSHQNKLIIILIYFYDILITRNNSTCIQISSQNLIQFFHLKICVSFLIFLEQKDGFHRSLSKYISELLGKFQLSDAKSTIIPWPHATLCPNMMMSNQMTHNQLNIAQCQVLYNIAYSLGHKFFTLSTSYVNFFTLPP